MLAELTMPRGAGLLFPGNGDRVESPKLIGTGKVSSQRDLGVGNSSPGVAFIWNPNLILNAPQPFTDAVMDWKEVAP